MLSSEDQAMQDSKPSDQPAETMTYYVQNRDTLRSIAVTYNTTTSSIMKLNKLPSTYIYPGQVLFLPKIKDDYSENSVAASNAHTNEEDSLLAPLSPATSPSTEPKLFRELVEVSSPDQRRETTKDHLDDTPPAVTCNGILQGGPIVSSLLASRQYSMPDEGRHKQDNSAKLHRMSSHDSSQSEVFEEKFLKTTAHFVTPTQDLVRGTFLVTPTSLMFDPDRTDPLAIESGFEAYEVLHKIEDIVCATMFKAKTRVRKLSSSSGASASPTQPHFDRGNHNNASTNQGFAANSMPEDAKSNEDELSQPTHITNTIHHTPNDHLSGVSLDTEDGNAMTSSVPKEEDFKYFYLCIQTSVMKTFSLISPSTKTPGSQEDKRKSKAKKDKKHSCFEVPDERSDSLLSFFMQWSPDNYTLDFAEQNGFIMAESLGEADLPKRKAKPEKHNNDRSRSESSSTLDSVDNNFLDEKNFEKEWEIISTEEAKRRSSMNLMELANDDSSLIPELLDPCPLLNDETLLALCKHLPARSIGYPWKLMYSTNEHGMSLKTLYRSMSPPDRDSSAFVLIQDVEQNIFGAFCSSQPRVSDHFYGNGECFLFKLSPQIEFYDWTGENNFFIKGNTNSMMFGGGDGNAGLWFDEKILNGRTRPCKTFGNAVLSCQEDFIIQTLEVWGIDV